MEFNTTHFLLVLTGGGLSLMILREVFKFINGRSGNGNGHEKPKSVQQQILEELRDINKHLSPVPEAIVRIEGRQHKHQADLTNIQNKQDIAMERQRNMQKTIDDLKAAKA